MTVPDGTAAQRAFEEIISDKTEQSRSNELYKGFVEYCTKDTLRMVELVNWLYEVSNEKK